MGHEGREWGREKLWGIGTILDTLLLTLGTVTADSTNSALHPEGGIAYTGS